MLTLSYPGQRGWPVHNFACYPMFSLTGHRTCILGTDPMSSRAGQRIGKG